MSLLSWFWFAAEFPFLVGTLPWLGGLQMILECAGLYSHSRFGFQPWLMLPPGVESWTHFVCISYSWIRDVGCLKPWAKSSINLLLISTVVFPLFSVQVGSSCLIMRDFVDVVDPILCLGFIRDKCLAKPDFSQSYNKWKVKVLMLFLYFIFAYSDKFNRNYNFDRESKTFLVEMASFFRFICMCMCVCVLHSRMCVSAYRDQKWAQIP